MRHPRRAVLAAGVAVAAGLGAGVAATPPALAAGAGSRHVLLISVDGMHQSDLDWYVATHPTSALALLVRAGTEYTHTQTQIPSDSFPGMVGQVTGGHPRTTGVYYDASYDHSLLAPGTTSCATATPGTPVTYEESLDRNRRSIAAGQDIAGLPSTILALTGSPEQLINPAHLPVDPASCSPVYPNEFLKVNTVFDVARAHGLGTAWADKHPAYEILDGPSGSGVQDLFTPEINSQDPALPAGQDWTTNNAQTQRYDAYKVRAVLNEIDGYDHSRSIKIGMPAIFGLNFQSVSTGQKLPTSDGRPGGYVADGVTPGPVLSDALSFVNDSVARIIDRLSVDGESASTTIILSAKHGQSPTQPSALTRIDDAPIISGLNAGWAARTHSAVPLVAAATDDDAMMMWLSDRSPAAVAFVRDYLLSTPATGHDITGAARTLASSGLAQLFVGPAAAAYFGTPAGDPRVPNVWGVVQHGVVYTGGTGKIAEHGGADPQDRHVPLVIFGAGAPAGVVATSPVETVQIAPTILRLLGLDPAALAAVRAEHTPVLPGA